MNKRSGAVQAKNAFAWLIYAFASLWLAISLSWWVYARDDYGYSFWYDHLDIGAHIQRYAPQHPYKHHFAQLPKRQVVEAFRQIRRAVHDHGKGLENIRYQAPGQAPVTLLDQAEVQHLRDVSVLLDRASTAFWPILLVWLLLAWWLAGRSLPAWRWRALALASLAALVGAVLLVVGPRQVFYAFHIWLFPAGHQWFFYWEESLMSTMMKAPDLFGGIAAVLAGVGVPLAALVYLAGLFLARRFREIS